MRDIKFRVRKEDGTLVGYEWLAMNSSDRDYRWVFSLVSEPGHTRIGTIVPDIDENLIREQYIGLTDENDTQVYENDILQDGDFICAITWAEHLEKGDLDLDTLIVGFVREWGDGEFSPLSRGERLQGIVVGNRAQNPELLEAEE